MCRSLCLPSLANEFLPLDAVRQLLRLGTKPLRFLIKAFVEGQKLFETTPLLHGVLLFKEGGRAQPAFSSQIKVTDLTVMVRV
jgi:hypothetical protein